jgi:calcineurin-like phosphoesterase family protein
MNKYNVNTTWFTSDTHFYHKNICKYCNRPFESVEDMNQGIIDNWNSVVKEGDTVFHLGDMGFCGIQNLVSLFAQLNGEIFLIIGNHDSEKAANALLREDLIIGYDKYKTITMVGDEECADQQLFLCHFPMIDWDGKERGSWMIHGHQHQLLDTPSCSTSHWDVGVDKNNWTPINFEQLKINITKQYVNR